MFDVGVYLVKQFGAWESSSDLYHTFSVVLLVACSSAITLKMRLGASRKVHSECM